MKKKDYLAIFVTLIVFSLMAFALGGIMDSEPRWGASAGGAIGFLAVYFYGLRKKSS